ncbi:hypothetical protein DS837_23465 [Azospirillum brasilense]|uniref:GIY-YIG domain-containing protein n=2 Tax=Azospirillum brasilense TaxID=192 RepID=A0A6L3AY53_AZOBR|nr:hypothetical protein DS837_23465 [Azospirillum brasilense]
MFHIIYNLINSANCSGMAPEPADGGGFTNATLPDGMAMPGFYIIVNTLTNNRYIGISGNIRERFKTRLATVTEMGFNAAVMRAIGVTWGRVQALDSDRDQVLELPTGPVWNPINHGAVIPPGDDSTFKLTLDGVDINLERLLIRFVLIQLGAGGTVSNNQMAATPYVNPTQNTIRVWLGWDGMGGLFDPGWQRADWLPGDDGAW